MHFASFLDGKWDILRRGVSKSKVRVTAQRPRARMDLLHWFIGSLILWFIGVLVYFVYVSLAHLATLA